MEEKRLDQERFHEMEEEETNAQAFTQEYFDEVDSEVGYEQVQAKFTGERQYVYTENFISRPLGFNLADSDDEYDEAFYETIFGTHHESLDLKVLRGLNKPPSVSSAAKSESTSGPKPVLLSPKVQDSHESAPPLSRSTAQALPTPAPQFRPESEKPSQSLPSKASKERSIGIGPLETPQASLPASDTKSVSSKKPTGPGLNGPSKTALKKHKELVKLLRAPADQRATMLANALRAIQDSTPPNSSKGSMAVSPSAAPLLTPPESQPLPPARLPGSLPLESPLASTPEAASKAPTPSASS